MFHILFYIKMDKQSVYHFLIVPNVYIDNVLIAITLNDF